MIFMNRYRIRFASAIIYWLLLNETAFFWIALKYNLKKNYLSILNYLSINLYVYIYIFFCVCYMYIGIII